MPPRVSRRQVVQGAGAAGLWLLAGCGRLPGQAQQAVKVARIGVLLASASSSASPPGPTEAFRQGLSELGYVEDQNIAVEYRWAENQIERLPDLAAELVRLPVDIILAAGTPAVLAAKNATTTISIVMVQVGDPVERGLVASFARPGGNLTGLSTLVGPQLNGKRLELLREAVPSISRVAVLWHPAIPGREGDFPAMRAPARALGLELQSVEVRGPGDLARAFEAAAREHAHAAFGLDNFLLGSYLRQIAELAVRSELPMITGTSGFAAVGGLMDYGPNSRDIYRRAATYVDRILKGANPADLPIEQPMRFDFVINLKTAHTLGLTIPHHVLLQATEVIQ